MYLDIIARTWLEGIWLSMAILLWGLISLLVALVAPFILVFLQRKISPATTWTFMVVLSLLGLIGAHVSVSAFQDAQISAAPELLQTMLSHSLVQGWSTLYLAAMLASLAFLLYGFSTSLPAALRPGPDPKLDLKGLAAASVGGGLGFVLAVIGLIVSTDLLDMLRYHLGPTILLFLLTLVATLAVLIASARVSGKSEAHRQRTTFYRSGLGLSGLLAVGLFGFTIYILQSLAGFSAVETASPELRATLFAASTQAALGLSPLGWCLGLIPLSAGLLSARASRPKTENAQTLRSIDVALASLVLIVTLTSASYLPPDTSQLFPYSRPIETSQIREMLDEDFRQLQQAVEVEARLRTQR
ncbi:MAG: hypothetical protein EA397_15775 [Deltaproteobacteria bacterium]|nr:MAG: hypothetical protein EA397_15775 [Deltaproteobacteria bacterium]